MKHFLTLVSSLRLTVVLLVFSMFLILAGTLAQVNEGIWTVVDRYFRSIFVIIPLQLFLPEKVARIPGAIPFPGGLTLGVLLFVNLIAAHAVRFKFTWRRSGIIIAHLGVILLLVGEFVTGAAADEGNMTIDEGGSSSFIEDTRSAELVVIDPSDPKDDLVIAVPQSMLKRGGTISSPRLPFEIQVNEWMSNSQILGPMQATPAQKAKADIGAGASLVAVPVAPANGVDGNNVDVPSAYLTLRKGNAPLGNYLFSVYLDQPQPVTVDGRDYGVQLRFKRTYKPYTLHLIDFKHDKFVGTDKPRNFSSQIRLVDPGRNVDREVLIYMNNPLRHAGETFYQSAFKKGDTGTILQVVRNPGWTIPYISCTVVTLGMLIQFGIRLAPSVRRLPR